MVFSVLTYSDFSDGLKSVMTAGTFQDSVASKDPALCGWRSPDRQLYSHGDSCQKKSPHLRIVRMSSARSVSHVLYHYQPEARAGHLSGAVHQARKVMGHLFALYGSSHRGDDEIGRLAPAHVPQHHLAR